MPRYATHHQLDCRVGGRWCNTAHDVLQDDGGNTRDFHELLSHMAWCTLCMCVQCVA